MKHQNHFQCSPRRSYTTGSILFCLFFLPTLFTNCTKEQTVPTRTETTSALLSVTLNNRYASDQNTKATGKANANKFAKNGIVEIKTIEAHNLLPGRPYEVNAVVSPSKSNSKEAVVFTSTMQWSDNSGNLTIENFEFFPDLKASVVEVELLITHVYPTTSGQGDKGSYFSGLLNRDPLLVSASSLIIEVVNETDEQ